MGITLCHTTALHLLRAARIDAGEKGLSLSPADLLPPSLDDGGAWTPLFLSRLKRQLHLPEREPLDVLVPNAKSRVRVPGVTNHVWTARSEGHCFLELEKGTVAIPTPEVLLAQMSEVIDLPELIALGHELCGRYSLRPSGRGNALTDIPAASSRAKLRQLMADVRNLRGRAALRSAIPRIRDDSLSPQETCLSTMVQLPVSRGGYQLGRVDLNQRIVSPKHLESLLGASVRVPDLLFHNTKVGINYDGDVHVDLASIVRAATDLAGNPGSTELQAALKVALDEAREDIAADKQRDRDLLALGYFVLPVTKHDLASAEKLDLVMRQVIRLIETTSGRDLRVQKKALDDPDMRRERDRVLSLLRSL